MNREQLYFESVDTLLDAFNNATLEHAVCTRCAVGNLCEKASLQTGIKNDAWSHVFMTITKDRQYTYPFNPGTEKGLKLIEASGYTQEELMRVEYAFESSIEHLWNEDWELPNEKEAQFIGLTAVLKVLKEIHEVEQVVSSESQEKLNIIASQFQLA